MSPMQAPGDRPADFRLGPFTEEAFDRILRWIDSRELMVQWAGPMLFHYPLDRTQLRRYLRTGAGTEPAAMIFTATDRQGTGVGHIELGAINRENGTASVCRVFVGPEHRGRGIARFMVRSVLAIGFAELHLRRIELKVYSFNVPAIRCYTSAGFRKEGTLRQSVRVGDRCWDTVLMGILRDEWKE